MKIGYLMQAGVPDMFRQPPSGPALHVKHVIKELQALGHSVQLLAKMGEQIWKSTDLENYQPVTIRWIDKGPLRLFESAVRRVQYELKLPYAAAFEAAHFAAACRQELATCDLFYERMGWMGYGGVLASRSLNLPWVLEVNGDHLTEFESLGIAPKGLQRRLSISLMRWAAQRAAHVVAAGEGWRQSFIGRWQVDPRRVTVVENGSELVTLLSRNQLRAFANTPTDDITIVYIGAFETWHGLTILLNALARVLAQGTTVKLVLIGQGRELETIKTQINQLALTPYVTLTGYLPASQLAEHLSNADIGVSPYCGRVEYSGLKLLDYKAAGLATIASGQNGQPAVLQHGQTGWIVPPCDETALSEAIRHLATNAALRQQIGRAARIEAETQHSWRCTAQQLEQLFTPMVKK